MQAVYVSGVSMTKFGKDPRPLAEIFCQAALEALAASKEQEVEALYIGAMNPEEFVGESNIASQIADAMGLTGIPAMRIETASSAGAAAIQAGFQAIASGYYRRVLVLGGEKMTHLSTSATTRILAEVIDKQERQCGATMPALAAMITEKYREKFRLSQSRLEAMLCSVALKNHLNGSRNPWAQFQQAITREAYLASKLVATPLRLYDCSPITDGAAAVVLASETRARALTDTPVWIRGTGQALDGFQLSSLHEDYAHWPALKRAAQAAYQMAAVGPHEIDLAEVHDCFSIAELIAYEELGFCHKGEAGPFVAEGRSDYGGDVVVNPRGGLIGCGHPLGATGVAQAAEVFVQLRGEAGARQVPAAALALTHNNSGMGEHVVMIYGKEPA